MTQRVWLDVSQYLAKVETRVRIPLGLLRGLDPIEWTVMRLFPRLLLFRSQISMASKDLEISIRMQDR